MWAVSGKLFYFFLVFLFLTWVWRAFCRTRAVSGKFFIYFVLLFLYNTLLTFLIKYQVGCDGTDVLVVQPGYRLISIADKYLILRYIKKCRLFSLTKLQKLKAYKIN